MTKQEILDVCSEISAKIEECHSKRDFKSDYYVNLCKEENRLRNEWHKLPLTEVFA